MKQKIWSVIIGLAWLLVPNQGYALLFTLDSATVSVGTTFSLNLNVADAIDLTSWQFDLEYNPTLLQANLVTEGSFLSSFGTTFFTPGVIDNTTGLISLAASSFVDFTPLPNGSGVLASIQFTALSAGLSPLTASNVFLNFSDSGFTLTNGSVCVSGATACDGGGGGGGTSSVPEPSTVALLSVGLGILYFAQRRQTFGERAH